MNCSNNKIIVIIFTIIVNCIIASPVLGAGRVSKFRSQTYLLQNRIPHKIPVAQDHLPFDRGTWVLTTVGSFCGGIEDDRKIKIIDGRTGLAYYFREGLTVAFELHASTFRGSKDELNIHTAGFGVASLLRWHLIHRQRWSIYLDYGVGSILTNKRFPPGGTAINGTAQYGFGFTFQVRNKLLLTGGVRQFHISNGKGLVPSNPSFDGIQGYAGIAWPL